MAEEPKQIDDQETEVVAEPIVAQPEAVEAPTVAAAQSGVTDSGARWVAVGDGTYRVTCKCGMRFTARTPGSYKCGECHEVTVIA
jgi:hypothetical protein